MIKVTTNQNEILSAKPFPKLMINKLSKTIVLFHSYKKGTVLSDVDINFYATGFYNDDWHMELFEDYNDTITLQNE
jgi:hypothetical protein